MINTQCLFNRLFLGSSLPQLRQEAYIHTCRNTLFLISYINSSAFIMLGKGRYFGLKGQPLNLAVGVIAGIDFL
jgi:hypothetical protein